MRAEVSMGEWFREIKPYGGGITLVQVLSLPYATHVSDTEVGEDRTMVNVDIHTIGSDGASGTSVAYDVRRNRPLKLHYLLDSYTRRRASHKDLLLFIRWLFK
jgi:hypothetical protein